MAESEEQGVPGGSSAAAEVEAAARAVEASQESGAGAPSGSAGDEATAVHPAAIPPLLTDPSGDEPPEAQAAIAADEADAPTTVGAPANKERIAEAASSAREAASDAAATARERGAEAAHLAKEKSAEAASLAKEKGAEVAAQAKEKGGRARERIASAAADAKGRASSAAADARERASNADVKEFAHNTTSLIDTARPFFLAGCAAIFAVLGFLEGEHGTAQIFAAGAVLCVVGAAFSGEINALLSARSQPKDRAPDHQA